MNALRRLSSLVCMLALLAGAPAQSAQADSYPSAPIRIVVPYAAGGGTDIVARVLSKKFSELLKAPVLVENRAGASGMIGTAVVAKAKPDGLTILLASAGEVAIVPHLFKKNTSYDAGKDLAPISLIARIPNVLVVNPDVPANSVAELIAYARANPTTFSSSGNGNIQGLTGEYFNIVAGVQTQQITYKGAPAALQDLIAKRVTMAYLPLSTLLPFIDSKQVRPLAVTSPESMSMLAGVPPIAATRGLEGFDMTNWYALFTTAGTDEAIVRKLNDVLGKSLKDPEVADALNRIGALAAPSSAEELKRLRETESAKFSRIIRDARIETF